MFKSALIYLKTKLRPQIAHKNCRVVIEIIGIADRIKCRHARNMVGERQVRASKASTLPRNVAN
jgi:hypothetical protein